MNIPPKYEDVVAQFESALGREVALTETVALKQRDLIEAQTAVTGWARKHDALQQRLTVADQREGGLEALLLESNELLYVTQDGLGGNLWSAVYVLRGKVFTALKPAEA